MRNCFILLMLCFHQNVFSQSKPDLSELSAQLNKVISDSNNNFLSFKGQIKHIFGDTVYYSTLHLSGTLGTEIFAHRDSAFISADIDTMLTEKEASSLVSKWKKYLEKILPKGYHVTPFSVGNTSHWIRGNGYAFSNANTYVSITYSSMSRFTNKPKKKNPYEFTKAVVCNVWLIVGKN